MQTVLVRQRMLRAYDKKSIFYPSWRGYGAQNTCHLTVAEYWFHRKMGFMIHKKHVETKSQLLSGLPA